MKEAAETEDQFREKILKVKLEQKTLSSQVKSLKVKWDNAEEEVKSIQYDKKELTTQLKSKVQRLATFQSKVEQLTSETDNSSTMIENIREHSVTFGPCPILYAASAQPTSDVMKVFSPTENTCMAPSEYKSYLVIQVERN